MTTSVRASVTSLLADLGLHADRLEVQADLTINDFGHWTNPAQADTGLCITWTGADTDVPAGDVPAEFAA